ncbi:Chloroperoxidase [Staphylotrichum tortipilum]|uniref:Chloroperoxidase n=1 Tax=Staphylotrichum tortipilum TaxID=2831512 RepID=A0AAN6RR04_9PEZI|nr:Chloroperoxidase [Staphylotrichum longicolle]
MKSTLLLPAWASLALAGFDTWSPPGPYEVRAPCPMLNTLANHGFLPHHGKDITREVTENALFDALNINKTLGSFLFDFALTTNPVANSTTFSLNDLGNHNILEHDASLSRSDAYFGNVLTFNQSVFDETKSYWKGKTVTIEMAARARLARIKTSKATNPTYSMSELGDAFTYGESAAYVVVFGDKTTGTVKRSWVEWLFEHEQLPQHLGWRRPAELFQAADLDRYMQEIENITAGLEKPKPGGHRAKRQNSHFGW